MSKLTSKLTVFFEDPFWVGLYEREAEGSYKACKITFGTEPKDYEVFSFLTENWGRLQFSPMIEAGPVDDRRINPKRLQREIKKQMQDNGIGTKAQQALKLQQEQGKLMRKSLSREQKEEEKERQFELKQEKRKAKHKGH